MTAAKEQRRIGRFVRKSAGACLLAFAISACAAAPCFADGVRNNMSGSCINDVGRGAMVWGASNEVTTYSAPYYALKAPEIYRIQTDEPAASGSSDGSGSGNAKNEEWRKKLGEVGTVYGTDGKVYEYYYVEGKEPRRIVETQRVRKTPKGGVAPVWMDETVERIAWEPVLIRVLRPAGSNAKDAEAARAANSANAANQIPATPGPCEPLSPTPEPCEPVGAPERQTYAPEEPQAPQTPGVTVEDTSNGMTPSAVGAETRTEINGAAPQNPAPNASPANGAAAPAPVAQPAGDASTAGSGQGATATSDSMGYVRLVTPDRAPEQRRPVITLPKSLERARQTQTQTRAQTAARRS